MHKSSQNLYSRCQNVEHVTRMHKFLVDIKKLLIKKNIGCHLGPHSFKIQWLRYLTYCL